MVSHRKIISAILFFYLAAYSYCAAPLVQQPDSAEYFSAAEIRYSNYDYKSTIKSVVFFKDGFGLSDPLIDLNSGEKLRLEFDDLEGNVKEFYLSVIHCSSGWIPSEIWSNEYLEGMQEERITEHAFSFNTRQSYTHYSCYFPNENMAVKLSGNYLLKVYTRDSEGEEDLYLTRRFMVVDPRVTLQAKVQRATTIDETETHQEIDFTVNASGTRIDAPFQDIHIVILQNGRWDNALTSLKPYMVKGDELDYSYDNGANLFPGGNEFRHFDTRSLKYLSDKVKEISYDQGEYTVRLWETERRTFKVYAQDEDIDGRFLLKTEDEADVETMGEYVNVLFFLPYSAPVVHGAIYVAGGFNAWQYTSENRMSYNFNRHGYEASLYLKQGYYNYLYTLLPNNEEAGDVTYLEGSHFETENVYTILVYYHERGTLYDQLIATGTFKSRNN